LGGDHLLFSQKIGWLLLKKSSGWLQELAGIAIDSGVAFSVVVSGAKVVAGAEIGADSGWSILRQKARSLLML
jgi:hypothetical protein